MNHFASLQASLIHSRYIVMCSLMPEILWLLCFLLIRCIAQPLKPFLNRLKFYRFPHVDVERLTLNWVVSTLIVFPSADVVCWLQLRTTDRFGEQYTQLRVSAAHDKVSHVICYFLDQYVAFWPQTGTVRATLYKVKRRESFELQSWIQNYFTWVWNASVIRGPSNLRPATTRDRQCLPSENFYYHRPVVASNHDAHNWFKYSCGREQQKQSHG
jgi:hypothetical protein